MPNRKASFLRFSLLAWFLAFSGAAMAGAGNTYIPAPGLGAGSAWTVYAFGNAQAVADAFRALANFTASGTFGAIVSMIGVIGVIVIGVSSGFSQAVARNFIAYIVTVFIISYVFFGAGNTGPLMVQVEVIDSVDSTWKAPVTVPAAVGIPAAIVSSAGVKMTQAIEASMALPDSMKLSKGAPFNLAASMISDASQARVTDPNLATSLAYYVQDCFTLGVARGMVQPTVLLYSTDFLNDIKVNMPGVMVNSTLGNPVGVPQVMSCVDAWTAINGAVANSSVGGASFLNNASAWARTPALSVVNASADAVAQWASNNGTSDGGAFIKQAAVLAAFKGASSQASIQTGNSEFLTGLAVAQATESQRTSWMTGAEVFNRTMGYIFAIIQVFVYAITPLVLCAALVPSLGMALLKNFAQILLWLAIWQPMLAIVNFIVLSMQQADLGGALSNGDAFGFSLANMGIVTEKTANLRAAAVFIGTMVPVLAWALVKGSVDFSRVIGSALGENFTNGAANTMATGNFSLNQASMDSFTANKHSTASTGAWSAQHSNSGAVGMGKNNFGGTELPTAGEQRMSITPSMTTQLSNGGQLQQVTQAGKQGSHIVSGGGQASHGESGGTGESGGQAHSSGAGTSLSAGFTGNFALLKPGAGGGPGAGNSPGSGGGNGNPDNSVAKVNGGAAKPLLDRASAGGSVGAQANATQQDVNNFQKGNNHAINGNLTKVGSDMTSGGASASDSKSATKMAGHSTSESRTITGFASTQERAEALTAALRPGEGPLTSGAWGRAKLSESSGIAAAFERLQSPDALQNEVKAREGAVDQRQADQGATVDKYIRKAETNEAAAEKAAAGAIGKAKADLNQNAEAASKPPSERVLDSAKKFIEGLPGATEFAAAVDNAKQFVADHGPSRPGAAKAPHAARSDRDTSGLGGGEVPTPSARDADAQSRQTAGSQPAAAHVNSQAAAQANAPQQPQPTQKPQDAADKVEKQPEQKPEPKQPEQRQEGQSVNATSQQVNSLAAAQAAQQMIGQNAAQQPGKAQEQKPQETQDDRKGQPDEQKPPIDAAATREAPNNGQGVPTNSVAGNQGMKEEGARSQQQVAEEAQQRAVEQVQQHAQVQQAMTAPAAVAPERDRDTGGRGGGQDPQESARDKDAHQQAARPQQQAATPREADQSVAPQPMQPMQPMQQQQPQQPPVPPSPQVQLMAPPSIDPAANGQQSPLNNVFSGEKPADANAQQMQGQVQIAEQRVQRLESSQQSADTLLASAEGKKPGELMDVISQARDFTRKG